MSTSIDIEVICDTIVSLSKDKNIKKLHMAVMKLRSAIDNDPSAVKWIVEPKNIKIIHDALVNDVGISPRALMLKGRVPNRQRRAIMMTHAIERAVNRVLTDGMV